MDLSTVKLEVLGALLLQEKPVKAAQIAKELGKEPKVIQMHLIGLVRKGYAESPEKGQYLISPKGKSELGLPEVTKEKALSILAQTSRDKAFHFYAGVGKPLNLYAHDLLDFCNKINSVGLDSVNFHMGRGDFEAWFNMLGDIELAKKMEFLKNTKLSGEQLCEKIHEMTENRCIVLSKIVGQSAPLN